jgi:hydrogenase expression/formation protein HypD
MKYLEEFRDPRLARALARKIEKKAADIGEIKLMEVCGSHTMAIARYGIRKILPTNIELISGPGCPVCVTPNSYLDKAIAYAKLEDVIITTFGDMMRVPGSSSSLEKERATGRDIRVVYSTMDALSIARKNKDKKVIFLGVGFETTAPTIAASVIKAQQEKIENYFVYCAHKTMPRPMELLAADAAVTIDGFICPAHVSTIIGSHPYEFLAEKYGKFCVIAGFEPLDILEAIDMLVQQISDNKPRIEIQYSRVTTEDGNLVALQLMRKVFEECSTEWRGIGEIEGSGLRLASEYQSFDAEKVFTVQVEPSKEITGCICGQVMQGISKPLECALFATTCTPENPVGACMVSSEGSCAAWYKYGQPIIYAHD